MVDYFMVYNEWALIGGMGNYQNEYGIGLISHISYQYQYLKQNITPIYTNISHGKRFPSSTFFSRLCKTRIEQMLVATQTLERTCVLKWATPIKIHTPLVEDFGEVCTPQGECEYPNAYRHKYRPVRVLE